MKFITYLGDIIMLFQPREEGQGLVEYALILVLVAVVVIAILTVLGPAIGNVFSNIVNEV
jgi:pilus assembly protein Flp/PilA